MGDIQSFLVNGQDGRIGSMDHLVLVGYPLLKFSKVVSKMVQKRCPLVTSSMACAMASSEMCFFKRSTVQPDTQIPILLSMVIASEPVPFTFRNSPIMSGKTFVARFRTKTSIVITIKIAWAFIKLSKPQGKKATYKARIALKTLWCWRI